MSAALLYLFLYKTVVLLGSEPTLFPFTFVLVPVRTKSTHHMSFKSLSNFEQITNSETIEETCLQQSHYRMTAKREVVLAPEFQAERMMWKFYHEPLCGLFTTYVQTGITQKERVEITMK